MQHTYVHTHNEKSEVSSSDNSGFVVRLSDQSLIYIRNNKGPRIEPRGAPVSTLAHVEHWSFRATLCFLLLNKICQSFQKIIYYAILLKLMKKTHMSHLAGGFGYIKKYCSYFIAIIK